MRLDAKRSESASFLTRYHVTNFMSRVDYMYQDDDSHRPVSKGFDKGIDGLFVNDQVCRLSTSFDLACHLQKNTEPVG